MILENVNIILIVSDNNMYVANICFVNKGDNAQILFLVDSFIDGYAITIPSIGCLKNIFWIMGTYVRTFTYIEIDRPGVGLYGSITFAAVSMNKANQSNHLLPYH